MKISPQEVKLNENMGPSKFSATGFMGDTNFSVDELITDDKRTMEHLGIDSADLVEKLELVYSKAQQAFGAEIKVQPGLFAIFFESRGKIPSPFQSHGFFDKGETLLFSKVHKKRVVITKLGIAMIKLCSFFQGPNSRYRIDPRITAKLLGIIK